MASAIKELYEFGQYRLNVDEFTLERIDGSKNGSLPEKAFLTLTILVRNHGRLVSKQELLDEVWPDAFVEENNIDKSIHAIRQILGERDGQQKFIETVRKHGYRFVADVRRVNEGESESYPETAERLGGQAVLPPGTPVPADRDRLRNRLFITTAAMVGVTAVLAAGYFLVFRPTAPAPVPSIAVLPLEAINSDARDEIYQLGIADSLIHRLIAAKGFVVRPLNATRRYQGDASDPVAAGRAEKVDFVIASNYQVVEGRIRVVAQLINVTTGQIEETVRSQASVGDKLALQDVIADDVANFMFARFGRIPGSVPARRGTGNEDAYRMFLRGIELTDQRNSADARKAQSHLQQAIDIDPNFARAYAALARAIIAGGNLGAGIPHEESTRARAAVEKALELDPDLASAHSALAELSFVYDWDFPRARESLGRALTLDPGDASAHGLSASILSTEGNFDQALAELAIALEIDPNSLELQRDRGRILYLARRYDEAVDQLNKILERDPTYTTALGWLPLSLEMKGDDKQAFEWIVKRSGPESKQRLQAAFEKDGLKGVTADLLESQKQNIDKPSTNFYRLARLSVKLGDVDSAIAYLEKAIEHRNAQVVMLRVEPAFDSVRSHPRYAEMLRRIGFR